MRDLVESSPPSSQRIPRATWLGNGIIPLLPVLACFLGGATQKWGEAVVVIILGFYLLIQPPRSSLGAPINSILVALALLGAVAFLPAGWFFQPPWRAAVIESGVPQGSSIGHDEREAYERRSARSIGLNGRALAASTG